jgi:cell division protein FtsI/penicillin-binding protein 2
VVAIFITRLFYLQIIRHDYYHTRALADQLKEYKIDAPRGLISAHDGASTVPIVLDETRYTLYADPSFAAKNAIAMLPKTYRILPTAMLLLTLSL